MLISGPIAFRLSDRTNGPSYARTIPVTVVTGLAELTASILFAARLITSRRHGMAVVWPSLM